MASNPRNADDDDDDFGDFGGFEAAEPAADIAASQAQAGASPWAVFNSGNARDRPDLLCAQNRFPPYLDPSDISGVSEPQANVNVNNALENGPAQAQANLFEAQFAENQNVLDQARIAENVLDGTLNAATGASFHPGHNVTNGRLPDIGLGINENRLFAQAEEPNLAAVNAESVAPPLELPQDGAAALMGRLSVAPQQPVPREEQENNVEQPNLQNVVAAEQPEERAEAAVNRIADSALQQRLTAIMERNRNLEEELSRCQQDLAAQRLRLQEVQDRHVAELEEVRNAGHDALALVVDQYKEQSRAVVLEQQEICQQHLMETLSEQMKAFQDMLKLQQELHEGQREEERQEVERKIDKAVEESRQKQQEQFDAFLVEEQVKQREAISQAVEAERVASQERIQKCIEAEQAQATAKLDEVKAENSQKLEEERQAHERALTAVREEEQRLAQEHMSQLMNEERDRGRVAMQEALEASRVDTRAYIDEQRRADSGIRRRHLASLDIFLEGARQQITALLETEKPEASSSSLTLPSSQKDNRHNEGGRNS